MSYYIQCNCGKKLTKKPMKTLKCPRCGSVYKKSNKFIYTVNACLFLLITLVFIIVPKDTEILTSLASAIFMYVVAWLFLDTLNVDILDVAILACGFLIFNYLSQILNEPLIAGLIAILFCVGAAAIFVKFFPYERQKINEN